MTIEQIEAANRSAGQHFFEADTLRFFRSRVSRTVYGGRFFVTSEQGPSTERRYTVREAMPDGSIRTVEPFNRLSRSQARTLAGKLGREALCA